MKAKWIGDPNILPEGAEVTILATDPDDPDAQFGRQACWIKWPLDGFNAPMYRSCNMDDLQIIETTPEAYIMNPGGIGPDDFLHKLRKDASAPVSGSVECAVVREMLLGGDRSNMTVSKTTYQEDRVIPPRSYDAPDHPLRPSSEIIDEVRHYARQIAGDTAAIRKSLNERYPVITAHLAKDD